MCFECEEKLQNFADFRDEVTEKQKIFGRAKVLTVPVKDEPLSDIAEILIAQNPSSDPFECEDFIKEESSQDSESKFEPEVSIFEESSASESRVNVLHKIIVTDPTESFKSRGSRETSTEKSTNRSIDLPLTESIKRQQQFDVHAEEYFCDICDKSCHSKASLLKHIRRHITQDYNQQHEHSGRDFQTGRKKPPLEVTKSCPVCHKTMKSNSIYSHIRLVHNKVRDQICQVKRKSFQFV